MRATILCYHKVGPEVEEGRRLNVDPDRLESHVRFFARRGHAFRRAGDLDEPWPDRTVCFSFDDAYVSALSYAPERLEKHGARGSFFAVSSLIGQFSTWDGDLARPLADAELLRAVQANGHEIGNHTRTHPRLASLSPEAQAEEIRGADADLRAIGLYPQSFCYPYGDLNDSAVEAVGTLYPVGLALGKRLADSSEDPRRLSRVVVAFSDSLPLLIYRLYVRPLLRR